MGENTQQDTQGHRMNIPPDLSVDITILDFLCLENVAWVATNPIGSPAYDFDFARYFPFKWLWFSPEEAITVVGRFGVAYDYDRVYEALAQDNLLLIECASFQPE